MVETRSQAQGAPLKKPGAYNTDAYYQEKDEGFGDVGVNQEPDAGALDDREDPDYKVTNEDLQQADARAAEEDNTELPTDMSTAKEEVADLTTTTDTRADMANPDREPVPIVEDDADDREAADVPENTAAVGP